MRKYYCVIPARGGSKRVPNKNIQEIGGKPLVGHVIENALKSDIFHKVYVSTDSEEIAQISIEFGALVPRLRKVELSDDQTPTRPVIADFIVRQPELQNDDSVIACLYPFAILSKEKILREAFNCYELLEDKSKFLVAIQRYSHPIQRALLKTSGNLLVPVDSKTLEVRTQDFPDSFHDAGQFYFAESKSWLREQSVLSNACGFEIPKHTVVDVDDMDDLEHLKRLFQLQF